MSVEIRFRHRFPALALDADFHAPDSGITALFGPSGSGKTTILNAVAGLLHPVQGRIAVNGQVLFDSAEQTWVPPGRRRVSYVFQDARLFPHLDVEGNLRFGWRRAQERLSEPEASSLIDMLGLSALLRRRVTTLSGGERARVALGRALMTRPMLLVLDEPFASLDTTRKRDALDYLERVRDNTRIPILLVTHALDEVARLANHLVMIREGRVIASGPALGMFADLEFAALSGANVPYGAVFQTTVLHHLQHEGLTVLGFSGGELRVPLLSDAVGTSFRTHLGADDIIIAVEPPHGISANNILPAAVSGLRQSTPAHVDVRLMCGKTALVARITRASAERLMLHNGQNVFAIVKSVQVSPASGTA